MYVPALAPPSPTFLGWKNGSLKADDACAIATSHASQGYWINTSRGLNGAEALTDLADWSEVIFEIQRVGGVLKQQSFRVCCTLETAHSW